jgi:hypothetical protein
MSAGCWPGEVQSNVKNALVIHLFAIVSSTAAAAFCAQKSVSEVNESTNINACTEMLLMTGNMKQHAAFRLTCSLQT